MRTWEWIVAVVIIIVVAYIFTDALFMGKEKDTHN